MMAISDSFFPSVPNLLLSACVTNRLMGYSQILSSQLSAANMKFGSSGGG
jgi:hypothetical protein